MYIHGYLEGANKSSGVVMTEALCTQNNLNILVFDYSQDASGSYLTAVINAMEVSAWQNTSFNWNQKLFINIALNLRLEKNLGTS